MCICRMTAYSKLSPTPVIDNQQKGPFKMHYKILGAFNLNGYNLNLQTSENEMNTGAMDTHEYVF